MSIRNNALVLTLAVLFAGCSSTPQFQTGPDAEVSYDGLTKLDKTIMDAVWAREDIDLSAYSKIMFEGVGVEYRDVKGPYSGRAGTTSSRPTGDTEFRLDDATKALFEEEIRSAFAEEVAKSDNTRSSRTRAATYCSCVAGCWMSCRACRRSQWGAARSISTALAKRRWSSSFVIR